MYRVLVEYKKDGVKYIKQMHFITSIRSAITPDIVRHYAERLGLGEIISIGPAQGVQLCRK